MPQCHFTGIISDSKVHGTNMGPTWVLLAPDGPHVGPVNFAIWDVNRMAALGHRCDPEGNGYH